MLACRLDNSDVPSLDSTVQGISASALHAAARFIWPSRSRLGEPECIALIPRDFPVRDAAPPTALIYFDGSDGFVARQRCNTITGVELQYSQYWSGSTDEFTRYDFESRGPIRLTDNAKARASHLTRPLKLNYHHHFVVSDRSSTWVATLVDAAEERRRSQIDLIN